MMTDQTRREVIKARAYGKTEAEIVNIMGVTPEDVQSVAQSEIDDQRQYLKEMGYI